MTETNGALPSTMTVSGAFTRRMPSQRLCDLIAHAEPAMLFKDVMETQPFRVIAFRALLRDFPAYDTTSLWLHAYDVEVDVAEVDPTAGSSPTASPPFAGTSG
jgi:hypothetical protein